jgi:S1-C subfamily serine protease
MTFLAASTVSLRVYGQRGGQGSGPSAGGGSSPTPSGTRSDLRSLDNLTDAQRRALRLDPAVRAIMRVKPAVVAIATSRKARSRTRPGQRHGSGGGDQTQIGIGSGVVVHSKGYVVTNAHVVSKATDILVRLSNGKVYKAKVWGEAKRFDLAILKISVKKEIAVAPLGSSKDLYQGETVLAIGTPFGLTTTVSRGIVSACKRQLRTKDRVYAEFLQTDAAINPGNSGGPLVNLLGEVIGINTAVHTGGPGIGFAIPIDRVKKVLNDLMRYGYVRGIYLGITVRPLKRGKGVWVSFVDPGSPAAKAGIRRGDVIESIMGLDTSSYGSYRMAMAGLVSGQKVEIVLKGRTVKLIPIMLTPVRARRLLEKKLGFRLGNAARYASRLGLRQRYGAVVLEVEPSSPAHRAGLRKGDVIIRAGRFLIKRLKHMNYIAARYRMVGKLYLQYKRGTQSGSLNVRF